MDNPKESSPGGGEGTSRRLVEGYSPRAMSLVARYPSTTAFGGGPPPPRGEE